MAIVYLIFFLNLALFVVLGLVSTANGAGPAGLAPVQNPLKPIAAPLVGAAGILGVIAVIWGFWSLIGFVLFLIASGSIGGIGFSGAGGSLSGFLNLIGTLVLIVVGTLAGYAAVASFFGAPASGAGKIFDWIKRTFGGAEAIFGVIALVFALWTLIEFILNRAGVYI